jgi:hypothetical protein
MSIRSAIVLARMALLFFLAESPFVQLLAGVYPDHIVPIILAGALVIAAPPGIVLARALQRGLEDEFAENYRKLERFYVLAATASQVVVVMATLGRRTVGAPGLVVSAAGMSAALWLLLKAAPAGIRRDHGFPTPLDQGRLD